MNRMICFAAGVVFTAGFLVGFGKDRFCGAEAGSNDIQPAQLWPREGTLQAVWTFERTEESVERDAASATEIQYGQSIASD
jgi:hypothetical protein